MSDKLKKTILIIVLITVNTVLIVATGHSVIKTISHVFETGGVSNSGEGDTLAENNQGNFIADGTTNDSEENNNETNTNENEIVQNSSEIEINLETIANGVKVIVSSKEKIDYLKYALDEGDYQKIEVGETQYEGIIELASGQHSLKVEVVDINKVEATKTQDVVGDTEPIVNVKKQLVNGKVAFVIDTEDDEKITTIELTHNGGEKQVIDVNEKTYHGEIIMTEGETNTLIITATNINGLLKTRKVKFDNK